MTTSTNPFRITGPLTPLHKVAARGEARYLINHVHVGRDSSGKPRLAATNGRTLAIVWPDVPADGGQSGDIDCWPDEPMGYSRQAVQEASKRSTQSVSINGAMRVEGKAGVATFEPECDDVGRRFPDIDAVMSTDGLSEVFEVALDAKRLLALAEALGAMSTDSSDRDAGPAVRLRFYGKAGKYEHGPIHVEPLTRDPSLSDSRGAIMPVNSK